MITYYVDGSAGIDTNDGLSIGTSVKTLQGLLNKITTFTQETKIILKGGTYTCDSTLVTKIPANIIVTVIGTGVKTVLKPVAGWGSVGSGWYPIGISNATLNLNKLVFDMTNMFLNNSSLCMIIFFNLNNVVIKGVGATGNGTFSPYNNTTYTFKNCVSAGPATVNARLDAGSLKVYNSYGLFSNGYASSSAMWNISNNVIVTTLQLDENYKITNTSVSKTVGVYAGIYAWTLVLLKIDGSYYCIKSTYYDTVTHSYNPIPALSFDDGFNIENLFTTITIGTDTFKPIDKFNNFQIVINIADVSAVIKGIKSTKELIVANEDIAISIANNIDFFNLSSIVSANGIIKLALSTDRGLTWKSHNGTGFIELTSSVELKPVQDMTVEELVKWDALKEDIYLNGITPALFNSINFNLLNSDTIRFAYVIERPKYSDVAETTELKWQFDAKGSFQKMKDAEYDVYLYEKEIKVISNINASIIKINTLY